MFVARAVESCSPLQRISTRHLVKIRYHFGGCDLSSTQNHSLVRLSHSFATPVAQAASPTKTETEVSQQEPTTTIQTATPSTNVVKVTYVWDKSPNEHSLLIHLPANATHITSDEVMSVLVEDKQNLRSVGNIKYFKEKLGGFVNLPKQLPIGNLKDKSLRILLDKSESKTSTIGPRFSFDMNAGLIWDTLNPTIRTKFMCGGQLFRRAYLGELKTVGLKVELAARLQTAFIFRPPFKPLFYHQPIELGSGVDIASFGFNLTWVSFKHSPGGLLCFGVPVGLTLGISYVRGGRLIPVTDPENTSIPLQPTAVNDEDGE